MMSAASVTAMPPLGASDNVPYPAHALDDAREAIAFVRKQAPGRRVIVAGLCSGGWHAFVAARAGLAVDAIVSFNPPLYLYNGEAAPSAKAWMEYQRAERFQTLLCHPSRWARALRSRSACASFLRFAVVHVGEKVAGRVKAAFGSRSDALARDLLDVSARGITSLFVFSKGERSLDYFRLRARAILRRRNARERIQYPGRRRRGSHVRLGSGAADAARDPRRLRRARDFARLLESFQSVQN